MEQVDKKLRNFVQKELRRRFGLTEHNAAKVAATWTSTARKEKPSLFEQIQRAWQRRSSSRKRSPA